MQVRTRTALVTLVLNTVLTVLKFIAFAFTGSLAILAEAWHSFGDIATSATALLSVRRQALRDRVEVESEPTCRTTETESEPVHRPPESEGPRRGVPRRVAAAAGRPIARLARPLWRLQPEQKAALVIGLVLAVVGVAVLRKVLGAEPTEVARPLMAGIAFLVFSLASYAVSRFELGVGEKEGSAALVADGLHARADAVATFLTGCSLIAYHFGTNLDRPVAGLLGVIILSFAAETLVNLVLGVVRGERRYALRFRTADVVGAVADPRTLASLYRRARSRLEGGGVAFRALGRVMRALPWLAALAIALGYASTTLYRVQPHERAVVERLGRVANPAAAAGPGLHLKAPWPIDRVYRVPAERVRHLAVGNQTRDATVPMIWTRQHGTDESFVSGDNIFFYPYVVLHWRISDAHAFRYGLGEPERMLENVAVAEMTRRFATEDFYRIALDRRAALDGELTVAIQASLDEFGAGIEVVDVVLKDVHPPRDVARSFEGVVAAMQDHETYVDAAQGYRNKSIPEARAEAVRQVSQAHAYVAENKTRSEGDAARFKAREEAFDTNRAVTRDRLYLDAMSRALAGRRKVLICPSCGQPDIWLDESVSRPPKSTRQRAGEDGGSSSKRGGRR